MQMVPTSEENQDLIYMQEALAEAALAAQEDEVPVGAVIVRDGHIIARGRNAREHGKNALAHAEIAAINNACNALGGWRLPRCTLYVTMEPCPMCAGAILNARIPRVVFAVPDAKAGAFGSVLDLNALPLNHTASVSCGLCREQAEEQLAAFFARLREKRRKTTPATTNTGEN